MRPSCACSFASKNRGRRECRAPDAPAASCAKVESTRVSHHGHAGSPGIPRAMVLTVSFALSPVTGLVCHRRPQETCKKLASRELDASVGASGPHDFAVRKISAFVNAPPASTASRLTSVTIAKRPLCAGRDGEGYVGDLGQMGTEIFLRRGLDRWNRIEPKGEFSLCRHSPMCNCASAGTSDGSPFKICEFIPHDSSRL